MRRTIARWLRRLADWLDAPPDDSPVLAMARLLTQAEDRDHAEWSGEAKRHAVYAALIKRFPDVPRRRLSRAIEDAL